VGISLLAVNFPQKIFLHRKQQREISVDPESGIATFFRLSCGTYNVSFSVVSINFIFLQQRFLFDVFIMPFPGGISYKFFIYFLNFFTKNL